MTTPVSRNAAGSVPLPPDNLSLGARFLGVVRHPGSTFQAVAARPAWAGILIATTLATVLIGAAVASTEVGRVGLVDQWERTAFAFGHQVTEGEYRQLRDLGRYAPLYAAATSIAVGPVLVFGVALLAHLTLARSGAGATVVQSIAVTAHAGVILTLHQLIAAPVGYLRETTASVTTLGVWLPVADQGSLLGRFLGVLDVFVLWWALILAIGFAVIYRRRARTIALGLLGGYAAVAGLVAAVLAAAAPQ